MTKPSEATLKPVPAVTPADAEPPQPAAKPPAKTKEHGGPNGPEPTRYGDWERNGRCSDF